MREVEFMGDKNEKHKKKKLTKKEQKALNHQKLMSEKKGNSTDSNVIHVDFNQNKKAA
jgi:hypothetical protein